MYLIASSTNEAVQPTDDVEHSIANVNRLVVTSNANESRMNS